MALEPETLDYAKSRKYLPPPAVVRTLEADVLDLLENRDFYQNGRRYVGPLPSAGDVLGWAMLRKSFAPILKVRETLARHVRGVIGREPGFEVVLDGFSETKKKRLERLAKDGAQATEDEKFADEADTLQGDVWDERGEHKIIKRTARRLLATGRVFLRYDVPPGQLVLVRDELTGEVTTGVKASSWQDAYRQTHMELCAPGSASVYVDPATQRKTAFFSFIEVEGGRKVRCVQVSWVDEEGLTQVRVLRSNNQHEEWFLDCGGELLVVEADVEPLVTGDLLQLQDIACGLATMVKINGDVAGFPQTDAMNVAQPTREETDAQGNKRRVPASMPSGPRTIRAFYSEVARDENGEPIMDDKGKPVVLSSSISYRDPVSSEPLRDDIEFFNTEIYRGMNQAHIATKRSANSSAELLVEERADYASSLLETKPDLEKLIRSVLKGRLCLAAFLAKDRIALGKFKAGRVRVDLQLNAGPLSVPEKAAIVERWKAGLMTTELAIILLGDTDDAQAELKKLDEQKKANTVALLGDGH